MALPNDYEYRFTEYEHAFDAMDTSDPREMSEFSSILHFSFSNTH